MFPYIEVNIRSGLELDKDYILLMDMKPFDDHRYKFHDGNWIPSMKADPPPVSMMYIHSDSPQKGSFWLSHTISFRKLKLTNCDSRKGHVRTKIIIFLKSISVLRRNKQLHHVKLF